MTFSVSLPVTGAPSAPPSAKRSGHLSCKNCGRPWSGTRELLCAACWERRLDDFDEETDDA